MSLSNGRLRSYTRLLAGALPSVCGTVVVASIRPLPGSNNCALAAPIYYTRERPPPTEPARSMPQSERSPARRADHDLIGKAARLHYEFGLTHREISEMLGISRVKVTRLLAHAREIGMVQITVNSDASPYALLETQLVARFELDEAVVVPGFDDEHRQRGAVAGGAAGYLQRVLRDGMTVTIGLSRTLALMPDFIVAPARVDATFVPLGGGLSR